MLPNKPMIHVSFGTTRAEINLGDAGTRVCPNCHESTPHAYYLQYKSDHFYHSFGWVTSRTYGCLCQRCKQGAIIPRSDLPLPIAQSDPIPWMHRYGAIFLGTTGLAGALLLCWFLLTFVIK